MKKIIIGIENLKRNTVSRLINKRTLEFKKLGKKSNREVFKELCFCLLTANFDAERAIKIQDAVGDGFVTLSEKSLAATLRALGYRYPNVRAKYIVEARRHVPDLLNNLDREWLVYNVKGLGYKEASHFLRNIGYDDNAIIDFHIVDVLARHRLIEKPKNLNKVKYLEIEKILRKIAKKASLTLAELDLYLWFLETNKVLK